MRNGQQIATCGCGRKFYVYSATVLDQRMCPICREEEVEGAEATKREVEERRRKKVNPSIQDLMEEMSQRKKRPGRYGQDIYLDESRKSKRDIMMCCK